MRAVTQRHQGNEHHMVRGTIAGLIGGLVASWTMNQFQAAWSKATEGFEKPHGAQSMQPSEGSTQGQSSAQYKENQDDATVKVARAISNNVFGHKLKESEKERAGAAVHYAFGTVTGGLYGAAAEIAPEVTTGLGLPFGAAFWMVADEGAVPLLGLSKGPNEYPISTHAYAFAAHLVYGLTAEVTRRAIRNII